MKCCNIFHAHLQYFLISIDNEHTMITHRHRYAFKDLFGVFLTSVTLYNGDGTFGDHKGFALPFSCHILHNRLVCLRI